MSGLRLRAGVLLRDVPRYASAWAQSGNAYLSVRNRDERISVAEDGSGVRCDWLWTSELHAPKIMPSLGRWIMRRALEEHPICLKAAPTVSGAPKITFVIGHRGDTRLPHLLKTLESIAGQQGVETECVVVEQDVRSVLQGRLPGWVRLVHTPPPAAEMPYCRSWALNVGAKLAQGELLVLHDGDILVPSDYAALAWYRLRHGYDAIDLKRFGFYLSEGDTQKFFDEQLTIAGATTASIVQNLVAGGSIAIRRDAFLRVGGMDEEFVGWGGEDNEFWERIQTLNVWPFGCLPYVHLWHPAQTGKYQDDNPTLIRHRRLTTVHPTERIQRLRCAPFGTPVGPAGWQPGAA